MKTILSIISLFISMLTFGQEKWTYQNDNIYKINKVKARKWFNGNKLTATTRSSKSPDFEGNKKIRMDYNQNIRGII